MASLYSYIELTFLTKNEPHLRKNTLWANEARKSGISRIDARHDDDVGETGGGAEPTGQGGTGAKTSREEKAQARHVVGWDVDVELMEVENVEDVGGEEGDSFAAKAATTVGGVDEDADAGAPVMWVEVVEIEGADGMASGLADDHEAKLTAGIKIGVGSSGDVFAQGVTRIGSKGATLRPNGRVVLPVVERVEILGLEGAQTDEPTVEPLPGGRRRHRVGEIHRSVEG